MRTHRSDIVKVAALAVATSLCTTAFADVTGGTGQEFIVSTSGATALSAFTRAGTDTSFNRGPYSLGIPTLTIGTSVYTIGTGQRFGIANKNAPLGSEPPTTADRIVYTYHEIGSVNGVNDVAQDGGLLPINPAIDNITSGNPFWYMGARINTAPAIGSTTSNGYTYQGKQPVRIAWSDVRSDQAFSIGGSATFDARPTIGGYGKGRDRPTGGTNFQQLTDASSLVGGVDPATSRLRNEAIAAVPFTISANPGTGLSKITEEDAQWLQAAGRLPNGANFNSSVRDIGSGTRNQAGNNLKLDPSWASGDRDRVNTDGTDKDPLNFNNNDDRPSATITYGDKTSGSSRLRPTIQFARMGLGVLSSGDVGGNGRGTGGTSPLRVLAIDWDDTGETTSAIGDFVQPTLANIADGKYHMWSASQAVTVTPDGTTVLTSPSAIKGDTDDDGSGVGIHRKFLNNITQSIAAFGDPATNQTPADAIGAASFIPLPLLKKTKIYDGDVQTDNPNFSQSALDGYLDDNASSSATLIGALNWATPATMNGDLANTATRYTVFAPGNNRVARDQSTANNEANLTIDIEARTVLAGDFNGDAARDLDDTEALALAYASSSAYLATGTTGGALNANGVARNYNGLEVASLESATVSRGTLGTTGSGNIAGSSLTFTAGEEGLLVLGDLNGNGNVTPTTNGNGTVSSVERADVKYFLYGAAVDTTGYADKMGDGIRLGQLKKNGAIDRFNAELNKLAADGVITTAQAAALAFDKFDVDGNNVRNLADARMVDANVGKDYTDLADVLSTWDDLVSVELDDNNVISATLVAGTSDFKLIRDALAALLKDGDTDFNGTVNFNDLLTLAQNYNGSVDRWSLGDFDLNGSVNFNDLLGLAQNYGSGSLVDGEFSSSFAADWVLAQSLVPEPTSLAVLGLAGAMLTRRRRA
jgi:hypothetical protein